MVEKVNKVERKQSLQLPLPRRVMILTTAAILFGNITFGCTLTSFPPVLEIMKTKYNTRIENISVIFTIITILYCIGAITCGFVSSYVNRQMIAIISLIGLTFSIFTTPHCPTKTLFFVIGGVLGFFGGIYDSAQIVWVIEIWQEQAGPFIQAQHFCFAIGTIFPPLIIAPFLRANNDNNTTLTSATLLSLSTPMVEEESRIYIPFTIIATFTCLALAFQLFLFMFYRYHAPPMYPKENFKPIDEANHIKSQMELDVAENVSNNQQDNIKIIGISVRKIKLVAITGMFLGAYQGMEIATMQFIPIFGKYSDLKMTESASAFVLTGLTGMYAIGRGIGIIVISKIRPELIICINFVFIIIANLILLMWANNSLIMYWVGIILLGIGYSTMFPSFCAFMEKYLVFTSAIASFIIVFGTTISATYPLILGRIIEENAVVLTYTNFFSTILCIIAMFWGYVLTRKSRNRVR